jgi:catechol 2,3-dioxygenase-like lactoylglutathione lyase family enzyme
MTALLRVARNVADLAAAASFYTQALGFSVEGPAFDDPQLAACLGLRAVRCLLIRRGAQLVELTECQPAGAAYPDDALSNDLIFQHLALVTADIEAAAALAMRGGAKAISKCGPQHLPASSGGVIAFKFRDPDGHPLEFLQFPDAVKNAASGYDHSAICVSDVTTSVVFYQTLGFRESTRQLNQGEEQDRLDGLSNVAVDVVALTPEQPTPHLELLHYRTPRGRSERAELNDIAADRLVVSADDGTLTITHDPDGHAILRDARERKKALLF